MRGQARDPTIAAVMIGEAGGIIRDVEPAGDILLRTVLKLLPCFTTQVRFGLSTATEGCGDAGRCEEVGGELSYRVARRGKSLSLQSDGAKRRELAIISNGDFIAKGLRRIVARRFDQAIAETHEKARPSVEEDGDR